MKSDAQPIDRSVHRLKDAMIDRKPSPVRFDRRGARTDLHLIPVIWFWPHDELRVAPEAEVWGIRDPDGPRRNLGMWPIEPRIKTIELLGEEHHVPIIRLCD